MSSLSERIASLTPERRAMLQQRLEQRGREVAGRSPARVAGPRESFPASFGQERLWFLDRLEPGSPAYILLSAFRLQGPLDLRALGRSLAEIVRRHEVLRSSFELVDGELLQKVDPRVETALPIVDLGGLPMAGREREARDLARVEGLRPFDLARGPLLRATLLRLARHEHAVLIAMHHIASDGWSQGVVAREVSALYAAFAAGEPSPLDELPVQYGDFAAWQRQRLSERALAGHLAFWEERLRGPLPVLELPADRPRPQGPASRGAATPVACPPSLVPSLRHLARSQGATLFMLLLAAFTTLLHRLTGQEDVLVGAPVANRTTDATAGLIGFFVNTIVLRSDLSGDPSFGELLARVRAGVLNAQAHQDLPFEKLVDRLQPGRNLGQNPLFQAFFVLQNTPQAEPFLPGLKVAPLPFGLARAQFDLSLSLWPGEGLSGRMEYQADLLDEATVHRWAAYFRNLLLAVAAGPHLRLSELPLLPESERAQLLSEWNDTAWREPCGGCVHEIFAAHAQRAPDAPALVCESQHLTYRGLDERSNRLARHLRRLGVGPEVLVGVYLERSVDMVVALLGVLKAGAAYVPLDPTYPPERVAFMLDDARAPVLLTHGELAASLAAGGARVVCLDRDRGLIGRQRGTEVRSAGDPPESLAYVIYTSGSTGRPKGAMNSHGALRNRLLWMQDAFGLAAGDRVLQKTPFSFDVSVWEFFWPLMTGACLVVARPGGHLDPSYLVETLAGEEITTVHFVPSMLRAFLAARGVERCRALRRAICSGEELPGDLVEDFAARLGAGLHNLYGPTEAAIDVTHWACRAVPAGRVPIGRPISNLRIHLLDRALTPVAIGAAGELCIAGVGLARGYLGRPGLTAERFVPDPCGSGERLYRTGDLARHLPDGRIEYLGRLDHQVKIRGFRIELGEIEAWLARHPAVRECAVAVRPLSSGDPGLVAYLVPAVEPPPAGEALRSFLGKSLPEHMIPAFFMRLDELPLSPSGKLDRGRLPSPAGAGLDLCEPFAAPSGPVEELLAEIWAEVLGRDQVGAGDNFFRLGGHSLLAMRVLSRLRGALGVDLPVRTVFEAPTLRQLGAAATRTLAGQERAWEPPRPLPRDAALPLSYAQRRLWFLDQLLPGSSAYNLPVPLRIAGELDEGLLAQTLTEVVRRHEVLRTTFPATSGRPIQVAGPPQALLPRVVDLCRLPEALREAAARSLAAAEVARPFDLARGPLLRALVLRLRPADRLVLVTTHHIVFDGSFGIFLREVATIYGALAAGRAHALPELPIQYADFADWQGRWLEGGVIQEQLAYWRQQLGDTSRALALPTDRPRPSVQSLRGAVLSFHLAGVAAADLKALAQRQAVTPFMLGLGAFAALLQRYADQDEILVGMPIADRPCPETEDMIGCFVNTLVLRSDLSRNPSFAELVQRVREATLGAYLHKDLPFELLVDELQPRRDLSLPPLFQVMFTFLAAGGPRLPRIPGLQLEIPTVDSGSSRFDLLVALREEAQGWAGRIEYSSALFDAATIRRWAGHLELLLAQVAADAGRRLAELSLLSAAERHQVRCEWNDTACPWPSTGSIHRLFEERVRQDPEAPAVIWEDGILTYGELDRRANRLARRLRGLGVGPGCFVAVHLGRGPEMVSAVLGILKSGGAYVPVATDLPAARIRTILATLDVRHAVTQAAHLARLRSLTEQVPGFSVLVEPLPAAAGGEDEDLPGLAGPEDSAYVIFTSGSTGTPKGVEVSHRAVLNLIHWVNRTFEMDPRDRVLFVNSLGFDLSVYDVFGILAAGGSIRVASAAEAAEPARLARLLAAGDITFWDSAPAALQQILALAPAGSHGRSSLRLAFLSGDWIPVGLPDLIRQRYPGARVVALGGATEATVWSNWYPVREVPSDWVSIPYGRPMQNAGYHLLDAHLNLCPIGVPGDLYIGGECLARGYARESGLSAEKFVPDPVSARGARSDLGGLRFYRTGDRARFWADGNIEFLGRLDQQVKVRGYRIELGEVEAVLAEHPGVRDAVVVARGEAGGDKSLVAYVVPHGDRAPDPGDLRSFLRRKLPDYMVPPAFVTLGSLPLTPNGKLDRRALPEPSQPDASGHELPRTVTEELLAGIWAQVLSREQVGRSDHFFELGGHSLRAAQMISRVREVFGLDLPLRAVFEAPALARLAESIDRSRRTAPPAPALRRGDRQGLVPASFAQERLWVYERLEPGTAAYNVPVAVRFAGRLDAAALQAALSAVVARHESLRTVFVEVDGQPFQAIVPASPVVLPEVDLAALPGATREAETRALAEWERARVFDLARGPLFRAALLRLESDLHALLVTMHHIVSDGWSLGILVREVAALYRALVEGEQPSLPALPVQYADHAAWQREWLQGEVLAESLAYWRGRLAGGPAPLELPHTGKAADGKLATERFELPAHLTEKLRRLSREEGATPFITLLAAFKTLLSQVAGQEDVAVGVPVAGRNHLETEGLIGFFVNTLVLRTDLGGDPTFRALLARVRETVLGAQAHQEVPFDKLIEELRLVRSGGIGQLYQASFLFQNLPSLATELPGLTIAGVELPSQAVRSDLDLEMGEQAGALKGAFRYSPSKLDPATVACLSSRFQSLLAAVVEQPDREISSLLGPPVESAPTALRFNDDLEAE